jgi:hypothetical protein
MARPPMFSVQEKQRIVLSVLGRGVHGRGGRAPEEVLGDVDREVARSVRGGWYWVASHSVV